MSEYRTLYRELLSDNKQPYNKRSDGNNNTNIKNTLSNSNTYPLWCVRLFNTSIVNQEDGLKRPQQLPHNSIIPNLSLNCITASSDGIVRLYNLFHKPEIKQTNISELGTPPVKLVLKNVYLPSVNFQYDKRYETSKEVKLGHFTFDFIVRDNCCSIINNYSEYKWRRPSIILVTLRLDGKICIYYHNDTKYHQSNNINKKKSLYFNKNSNVDHETMPTLYYPTHTFTLKEATGTTLCLLSSCLISNCNDENTIYFLIGCIDGSVKLFSCAFTPITLSNSTDNITITPLQVLGNAEESIPMSISIHPKNMDITIGRKNGLVDIYNIPSFKKDVSLINLEQYKFFKRITQHAGQPVRATSYTPDGLLLLIGSDDGQITTHDVSSPNCLRMTGHTCNAHGVGTYILSLRTLGDSRRFITSGSDGSIRIWDVTTSLSRSIHNFDGHVGFVWGIDVYITSNIKSRWGGRPKEGESTAVSVGEDGWIQIYAC